MISSLVFLVILPLALFRDLLTIRQNSLYVTVCMIVHTSYQGYFTHSLSTLYFSNAPSLTTRLTGDYRDRTYTSKCGPALLDTQRKKRSRCSIDYSSIMQQPLLHHRKALRILSAAENRFSEVLSYSANANFQLFPIGGGTLLPFFRKSFFPPKQPPSTFMSFRI